MITPTGAGPRLFMTSTTESAKLGSGSRARATSRMAVRGFSAAASAAGGKLDSRRSAARAAALIERTAVLTAAILIPARPRRARAAGPCRICSIDDRAHAVDRDAPRGRRDRDAGAGVHQTQGAGDHRLRPPRAAQRRTADRLRARGAARCQIGFRESGLRGADAE